MKRTLPVHEAGEERKHKFTKEKYIIFNLLFGLSIYIFSINFYILTKQDFEKVYDKLKWLFVLSSLDTLKDTGFPDCYINVVKDCISSSSMQIIWNEEALEILDSFKPLRSIRQCDLI